MTFHPTPLAGAFVIRTEPFTDSRGSFSRLFCARELEQIGLSKPIAQINHSVTRQAGTIRGLHYQRPPCAETKIVTCLRGAVYDVIVDIRQGSPTFCHWHGETLTSSAGKLMVVPEGFAHGFQTLEPDSELLYLHTEFYTPAQERAVRFDDPRLGIDWPVVPVGLSERDATRPLLDATFVGITP